MGPALPSQSLRFASGLAIVLLMWPYFQSAANAVLFGGSAICAVIALWLFAEPGVPSGASEGIVLVTAGFAIFGGALLIGAAFVATVSSIFARREIGRHPSAVIVHEVFTAMVIQAGGSRPTRFDRRLVAELKAEWESEAALQETRRLSRLLTAELKAELNADKRRLAAELKADANHRETPRFKRQLAAQLEQIAVRLEREIVRELRSGDVETDQWLTRQWREMATATRALKRDVLLSTEGARSHLEEQLVKMFSAATLENWDEFPRAHPKTLTRPEKIRRIREFAAVLARAGLPFLILWLLQQTSLRFDGRELNYARGVAIAWAALTLLALLDPLFDAKISAMTSLTGLFPGRSKKE
jgi:hypothetical protein